MHKKLSQKALGNRTQDARRGNFCFIFFYVVLVFAFLLQVCSTLLIKRKNSILVIKYIFPKVLIVDVSSTTQSNISNIKLMTKMQNFAVLQLKGTQMLSSSILHLHVRKLRSHGKVKAMLGLEYFPKFSVLISGT